MSRHAIVASLLSLSAFVAACGSGSESDPVGVVTYRGPAGTDTTKGIPAKVQVSGRVLGVDPVSGSVSNGDSLKFTPIGGTALRVMRNVLVNGQATQVLAVELTADSKGHYVIKDLPGGYYIIYATPPRGSPYNANWAYLPALQLSVTADVYLWRPQ